ncbi:hypothetical protein GPECTOR_54g174 [Gonium pectorale]|uniref:UBC core domain-containing protein n=1 Tax=Gonium pectorale TaxID=33097 RepID=A0A150G6H7_GONPE|nr:hypothetical protein GPECTOR_54g174 [Gonium pectorale]|eukprot:KXZ45434.1 hypothetical protein GPECTOR_54g174 [Gonium pectorale]
MSRASEDSWAPHDAGPGGSAARGDNAGPIEFLSDDDDDAAAVAADPARGAGSAGDRRRADARGRGHGPAAMAQPHPRTQQTCKATDSDDAIIIGDDDDDNSAEGRAAAVAEAEEAAGLAEALREAVGLRCAFLCPDCDRCVTHGPAGEVAAGLEAAGAVAGADARGLPIVLPRARMQALQSGAEAACRALRLLRHVRAVLLSADEEEGEDDGDGGGAAVSSRGRGRGGRGGRGRGGGGYKRRRSGQGASGGSAWAKGVGYGGDHYGAGVGAAAAAARQAAHDRQESADREVRACLAELSDIIAASCRTPAGGGAAGGGAGGGAAAVSSAPPPVLLAALQYGGLPYVLRLLLQNDSLLDMAQRQALYGITLALVRRLTSDMTLLELLVLPAADPKEEPSGGEGGGAADAAAAAAAPSSSSSDPPLSAVFESLARQCSVFKRAAEDLADGADEDIAALSLALELGALAEEVAGGVGMWRASMGGATGILAPLLRLPGAVPAATVGAAAAGGEGADPELPPAKRVSARRGAAAGATAAAGTAGPAAAAAAAAAAPGGPGGTGAGADADDSAARRSSYVAEMRPLQFCEVQLMRDHYFRSEAGSGSSGGEQMRQRLRRITGEISGLASGLPLDWEAAAFVAVDENRVDVLRALLIPASDTPYANGPFIFDIFLPPAYPNTPPKVQFLTTGGGRVRFNPNLYAEGKVCLSLLGTWAGPSWDPAMSTILQVLVSIQSMILVSDPYYNEPGWERQAHTAAGRQAAADYANSQRYNTLAFAILPALKQCTAAAGRGNTGWAKALDGGAPFTDVLTRHFTLKRPALLRQIDEWSRAIAESAQAVRARRTAAKSGVAGGGAAAAAAAQMQLMMQMGGELEQLHRYTEQILPQLRQLLEQL